MKRSQPKASQPRVCRCSTRSLVASSLSSSDRSSLAPAALQKGDRALLMQKRASSYQNHPCSRSGGAIVVLLLCRLGRFSYAATTRAMPDSTTLGVRLSHSRCTGQHIQQKGLRSQCREQRGQHNTAFHIMHCTLLSKTNNLSVRSPRVQVADGYIATRDEANDVTRK